MKWSPGHPASVQGFGDIRITKGDFFASGGEGDVYVKGQTAYKIYKDPDKMIPVAKIKELSSLTMDEIIKPKAVILDGAGNPIGFTMKYVKDTTPLVRLFTRTFKQNTGITPEMELNLVRFLQKIIDHAHQHHTLIVDINENNFLADKYFEFLWAIDVNSWQTRNFPATAIMGSVRDYHTKGFTQDSDWFSWAVLVFQLLIGVHPYRGNHPDFKALPISERMEARMKKNVSVFDSKTRIPAACNSLDSIPNTLRQWLKAVFEEGHRSLPPKDFEGAAELFTKIQEITGSHLFEIKLLEEFDSEILRVNSSGFQRTVTTKKDLQVYSSLDRYKVLLTPKMQWPVKATLDLDGKVELYDTQHNKVIPFNSQADAMTVVNGRLILKTGMNLVEVVLQDSGQTVQAYVQVIGQVLEKAKVYDGVVIQDMLGHYTFSLFPKAGYHHQYVLAELSGHRIIDAKYENQVLGIMAQDLFTGKYDRFMVRFSSDHTTYSMRKVEDVTYYALNFTVADHGTCVLLNEEDKIEAFSKSVTAVKILDDPGIDGSMRLFHDGSTILLARGPKLYSITMKQ